MTRVLVTGGTGVLGQQVRPLLKAAGYTVRAMSRHARPAAADHTEQWAQADLATGAGLAEAVAGVQAIVHAASDPARDTHGVDVDGTRRLIDAAVAAGCEHLVYISIVGIERIPLAYYTHKVAAEQVIARGGLPWTILRTTQFHELIDYRIGAAARRALLFLTTDRRFQPLASEEAAEALVQAVGAGPAGRLPDMGGPEVHTLGALAREWLAARHEQRRVWPWPTFGAVAAGYRNGYNTCPDRAVGRVPWGEWLRRKYGGRQAGEAP